MSQRNPLRTLATGLWSRLSTTPTHLLPIYFVVYLAGGAVAQLVLAPHLEIARFARDWQFLTLYGGFLVPLSLAVRGLPWHQQYAYSLMAIAPVEISAFALGTSVAYPANLFDAVLGPHNFTLAMVMLAAWLPYLGNLVVATVDRRRSGLRWSRRRLLKITPVSEAE